MLRALSIAAALLCPQAAPAGPAGRAERAGKHFVVSVCFSAGDGADQALRAAEATWPIATELLDAGELSLSKPLEIVVYPDASEYEAAEQRMTKGRFRQNLSFSHWDTKTAHVALQPPRSPEALQELGLPWQTLRSIAHEAAHLACYEMLPNYRFHPAWFAEGYACYIEELAMKSLGWSAPCEEEPYFSSLIARCQQLASKAELPSFEDLLAERIGKLSTSDSYAVRSLFFEYLHSSYPTEIGLVIERLRERTVPNPAAVRSSLRAVWPSESGAIDVGFAAFLGEKKPHWDEVCRSLQTASDGFLQSAFADSNAIAWNSNAMTELPFGAEGSLRILPGPKTQLNFLLGRQEEGFFSVAFTAGWGVTVYRYRGSQDSWTTLARAQDRSLEVGREVGFRIRCSASAITVALDGDELLRAPIDSSPLGAWGLGAQNGSTGEWKRIRVGIER